MRGPCRYYANIIYIFLFDRSSQIGVPNYLIKQQRYINSEKYLLQFRMAQLKSALLCAYSCCMCLDIYVYVTFITFMPVGFSFRIWFVRILFAFVWFSTNLFGSSVYSWKSRTVLCLCLRMNYERAYTAYLWERYIKLNIEDRCPLSRYVRFA